MAVCTSCTLAREPEREECAPSHLLGIPMGISNHLLEEQARPATGVDEEKLCRTKIGRGSSGIGRAVKEMANMHGMTISGIRSGRKNVILLKDLICADHIE